MRERDLWTARPWAAVARASKLAHMIDAATLSRVILVADRQSARAPASPVMRRYRLARLELNGQRRAGGNRFGHLKRIHD
jgi:hypothetical protein